MSFQSAVGGAAGTAGGLGADVETLGTRGFALGRSLIERIGADDPGAARTGGAEACALGSLAAGEALGCGLSGANATAGAEGGDAEDDAAGEPRDPTKAARATTTSRMTTPAAAPPAMT